MKEEGVAAEGRAVGRHRNRHHSGGDQKTDGHTTKDHGENRNKTDSAVGDKDGGRAAGGHKNRHGHQKTDGHTTKDHDDNGNKTDSAAGDKDGGRAAGGHKNRHHSGGHQKTDGHTTKDHDDIENKLHNVVADGVSGKVGGHHDKNHGRGRGGHGRHHHHRGSNANANANSNANSNANANSNSNERGGGSFYDEFMSLDAVNEGLQSGTLYKGKLRVMTQKRRTAFVTVEGAKNDVQIEGEKDRNRCIDGDEVVLQLLPESEWPERRESTASELAAELAAQTVPPVEKVSTDVRSNLWCANSSLMKTLGDKSLPAKELPAHGDAPAHAIDFACRPRSSARKSGSGDYSLQPRGKIVYVLKRAHKLTVIGEIQLPASFAHAPVPTVDFASASISASNTSSSNTSTKSNLKHKRLPESETRLFFHALDKRYPHIMIQRNILPDAFVADPQSFANHIFAVDIVSGTGGWPVSSKFPMGDNLRSVGESGSIQSETEALLLENGIHSTVFDDRVIESLREYIDGGRDMLASTCTTTTTAETADTNMDAPSVGTTTTGWQIPAEEVSKRLDLRDTCIFTIDPSGAKDLDDALHITPLGDDLFEIGVHIADVSYFVRPGTSVDDEASVRATSVYLVQKVIPMLPPILCEELCSLNPNVDRLAYSCIWKMRRDGTLLENSPPQVIKTIIRSCAKMDYITAQRIIDGRIPASCSESASEISEELWEERRRPIGHSASQVVQSVLLFNEVAQNRRALRMSNGALVLNKTKLSFRLDMDGNPSALSAYPIYDSNRLVEEYMLMANYLVAQELLVRVGNFAFIRNHPAPELGAMDVLDGIARLLGVSMDMSSSAGMQDSLQRLTVATGSDTTTMQAITALLMKPMQLAQYIIAGKVDSEEWRHFALCIPYYTHFTSPIRRYADVMVHRLLHDGVDGDVSNPTASAVVMERYHSVAERCNMMKKASKDAQERSDIVFFSVFLMSQPDGVVFTTGVVIGLGDKSFTVLVSEDYGGGQTRMFVDDMEGVTSTFDKNSQTLTLVKENSHCEVARAGDSNHRHHGKRDKHNHDRDHRVHRDHHNHRGTNIIKPVKGELSFTCMTIQLMTRVRVVLSAKESVPIDVRVGLVGPI